MTETLAPDESAVPARVGESVLTPSSNAEAPPEAALGAAAEEPEGDRPAADEPAEHDGSVARRSFGSFVLFAAPFLVASAVLDLFFTLRSTTNIVFADTWSFVPMIGKVLNGHFSTGMLWAPHNENRQPLLRAIFLVSARVDHFNVTHLRIVGIVFLLLAEALLLMGAFMLRQRFLRIGIAIGITLVASCAGQWESMFLEENSMFFLTVAGAVAAFWLLESALRTGVRSRLCSRVLPMFACGIVASLCLVGGFAVWPTLALRSATYRRSRENLLLGAVIGVFGLLEFLVYAWNMPGGGLGETSWRQPGAFALLRFFVLCAGNSIFNVGSSHARYVASYVIGTLLLIGMAWSFWNGARRRGAWRDPVYGVGLSLQCFGLLQVLLIEYARIGVAMNLAFGSRYTTLTQTLPIGLLLCLGSEVDRSWVRTERRDMSRLRAVTVRTALWAAIPLIALGVVLTDVNQLRSVSGYHANMVVLQRVMVTRHAVSDQQLSGFEWVPSAIRQSEVILRHFHLNAYQS